MEILEELRTYVHKATRNYPEDRETLTRDLTWFYERIDLQYESLTAPDQEEEREMLEEILDRIGQIKKETREVELHTKLISLQGELAQISCMQHAE